MVSMNGLEQVSCQILAVSGIGYGNMCWHSVLTHRTNIYILTILMIMVNQLTINSERSPI